MIPVRHRLFFAWLALLAMLMLVVAPTVSQSLAAQKAALPAASHAHHSEHEHSDTTHGGHDPAMMAECGYCTLSLHTPVVPASAVCTVCLPSSQRSAKRFAFVRRGQRRSTYPPALPRAPPLLT